ncbi:MAG: HlyD family efflux transporter periplasmic adaptor subunit, partial [Gammaproteobacteria bacterium]|nr:HlyD family efflux transporter periplasmic adaptor subunit [Gammaproteobacteria bacterium]
LMVAEGDVVEAGAPLARVRSPRIGGRDGLALNRSQSSEGTHSNPVESDARSDGFDADSQGKTSEVAVQTLVVNAARALPNMAELSQPGLDGSSHRSVERDGDHIVAAPISGRIEALVARKGQYLSYGSTVALVAASDRLVAEIDVPSHVAGLITSGQRLRLTYEGLPFGPQGVQQGIVTHVSRAPLAPDAFEDTPIPATGPVYRAQVRLPAQQIDVGGVSVGLRAGMRLTAEIPGPGRTLFQTLYETIR